MRIGILGTGRVGRALGETWAGTGHEVVYGSRRPRTAPAGGQGGAPVLSIAEAAAHGEVVVLAVPFAAVPDVLAAGGDLGDRVVVDATNPMGATLPPPHTSGAEVVADLAPGARVVKAFNTMAWETMIDPLIEGQAALGLVCGDDAAARTTVLGLARQLGFDAVDAGGLDAAHLLEGLAVLWIHLAFRAGLGRDVAFALLRRPPREP